MPIRLQVGHSILSYLRCLEPLIQLALSNLALTLFVVDLNELLLAVKDKLTSFPEVKAYQ